MPGLEALLEGEADAEIEAALAEAKERAAEITARAEEEAKALLAQRERANKQQNTAALARAKSGAQLEAASLRLRAQHQAVEAVFSKAKDDLQALISDKKRYPGVLEQLLREAVDSLEGKLSSVSANPKDQKLVEAALKKMGSEAVFKPDPVLSGGVRVAAAGSHVSIENGLFDRLEAAQEELASEVSKMLFARVLAT